MQLSDKGLRLPITFESDRGDLIGITGVSVLMLLMGLLIIYLGIDVALIHGLDRMDIFEIIVGVSFAVPFAYFIWYIYFGWTPNVLVIGREGVTVTRKGPLVARKNKSDFAAWSEIQLIQSTGNPYGGATGAALVLTPDALTRRFKAKGSRGLPQASVDLGVNWGMDGRDLRDLLEQYRQALTDRRA